MGLSRSQIQQLEIANKNYHRHNVDMMRTISELENERSMQNGLILHMCKYSLDCKCGNCKKWTESKSGGTGRCAVLSIDTKHNFYCSEHDMDAR